jgi:nucleotide-binding universal stress UspA family protein
MFKTIMVGLDGSKGADHALDFAVDLARRDGAALVLATVDEVTIGRGVAPVHTSEEVRAEIDRKAEELRASGLDVAVEQEATIVGGPAAMLAKIAESRDADLVVVGTRGHSAAAGVVLGSVSQRLLHIASQPVLVVPETAQVRAEASAA